MGHGSLAHLSSLTGCTDLVPAPGIHAALVICCNSMPPAATHHGDPLAIQGLNLFGRQVVPAVSMQVGGGHLRVEGTKQQMCCTSLGIKWSLQTLYMMMYCVPQRLHLLTPILSWKVQQAPDKTRQWAPK